MQKQEGSMSSDQQASLKQITYPCGDAEARSSNEHDQLASLKQSLTNCGDAEARRLK